MDNLILYTENQRLHQKTLRNNKQHNLSKLSSSVKRYSDKLETVFHKKRLFTLLKAAYVDARYNPHFVVTKEDIDKLIPKVESLREITERICEEWIYSYDEKKLILYFLIITLSI